VAASTWVVFNFFFVEGMFKKLQVGCPMAGLMVLKVFSQIPELKESEYAWMNLADLSRPQCI